MCTTPLNGLPRQGRLTTNGPTTTDNGGTANFTAPYWLRLTRSGDDFTCFRSTDGSNWFPLGPVRKIPGAPETVFAGVMIASLNNSGNSVVSMDKLSVVESGPSATLPEILFPPGQNPSASNGFTLSASTSGGPAWSWQKVSGPGELIFRSQNSASPQTAFTEEGIYLIRAIAETSEGATFIEQTQILYLDARWDFDTDGNSEGWNPNNSSISVANGVLTGIPTNGDPQLSKRGAVYVSGSLVKRVIVRYRGTSTGTAQLFWGRVGAASFSSSRVINFPSYSPANTWNGITANPSTHADWNGREIIDFRFDPTGGAGSSHDIDWIALSTGTTASYARWIAGFPGISDPAEGADPDGDGWSNRDEWIAGTDPTHAASRFTTRITAGGGLSFVRKTGRMYVVETSTTLGSWSIHSTVPSGSGEIIIPPPDPTGEARFYRVLIKLDPP
jgi:hypothetical protein